MLEEARPVADAVEKISGVNKIDGLGFKEPVFFCVVDFEAEVWWDPGVVRHAMKEKTNGLP